ncbi:MAG TPA: transcription-repair coupling factor [Candidatus Peregrinibacteria bacterium]|nr:transcription-repair coupling factor [Candidatus Peregrinibacteria bacterium]
MDLLGKDLHSSLITHLQKKKRLTLSGAGSFSSKSFLIADVVERSKFGTTLWVVESPHEAESLVRNLEVWFKREVLSFTFYEDKEEVSRTDLIYEIQRNEGKIIIIDIETFLETTPPKKELEKSTFLIEKGMTFSSVDLINRLLEMGYSFSEDAFLEKGSYCRQGDVVSVFVPNLSRPIKIDFEGDKVAEIFEYDLETNTPVKTPSEVKIVPLSLEQEGGSLFEFLGKKDLLVWDELDVSDYLSEKGSKFPSTPLFSLINFTAFPEEDDQDFHYLYYLSVLKFQDTFDFLNDLKEKRSQGWKVLLLTKNKEEISNIFLEEKVPFQDGKGQEDVFVTIVDVGDWKYIPRSFQNSHYKVLVVTDREIFDIKQAKKRGVKYRVYLDFLTKLKIGDYVVHADHGVGRFLGIERRAINEITREYLKIAYAENDRLFVPIDQAEKVNKYIGIGNVVPRLTRLGSVEWSTIKKRVRKETEKIARELLALYAKREAAKGFKFLPDGKEQEKFEETFPYEETPGQIRAIIDTKKDMEVEKPMDRLICGDVGFGKTEVALRAAFKAVRSGKQVAFISPITILADQHYRTFSRRMDEFGIRIEMLSRFRTAKEQREILEKIKKGKIDIIIGTHRLFQPDVEFKDLGLVIIDEEQRFGVKQKEKFKEMRAEVDILTLTATPIPRTLNMSLNGIRDITTITTPPHGRLPIITEVRKFSESLIHEAITRETERKGQVYFLHNRVQTIESMADKLRTIFPDLKIVVAHGKLPSHELEKRVIEFKNKKYDVLVSSTIIENGIDLANANTLIVNNAENFGLAQLYQLRGRIGRGKVQAYAYFLYQSQRLKPDARKRLRAIVEASELGSGFQIAMRDLEIRGAGDILGASQHGSINVVGVNHFVRMLHQAVEEMKEGKETRGIKEAESVTIDLPITGFIPDDYIEDSREKINVYQKLSSADNLEFLNDLEAEVEEEYGEMPAEVKNLFRVLELKILARRADITNLRSILIEEGKQRQIILTMSSKIHPLQIVGLLDFNEKWQISESTLKITMKDLGFDWIEGLKENLKVLGKKEEGKKKKKK